MRGTLRKKLLKSGKYSLYIDYYPQVWNPIKQVYTRREFLNLYLHQTPTTQTEKKENELYQEIAYKIFVKRMKSLMLDANGLFNKDALEADFFGYALKFIQSKQKDKIDTTHYETVVKYLNQWTGGHCKFRHIDEKLLVRFKDHLLNTISLKSKFEPTNGVASYTWYFWIF